MASCSGAKCLICGKQFSESDDIVVCPECGTPYHRECYAEKGKCINDSLHESGESWKSAKQNDAESKTDNNDEKICPVCGNVNKAHSLSCQRCGTPLIDNMSGTGMNQGQPGGFSANGSPFGGMRFDPNDKYCGMNPEEEFDGVKLSEVSQMVGKNRYYYLPLFKRMKDTGKKVSFNLVCLFVPQLYFANRKMWFMTAAATVASFLLSLPTLMYYMVEMNMAGSFIQSVNFDGTAFLTAYRLCSYLNIAFTILMCLFSNWIYYRHIIKKVKRIKETATGSPAEAMAKSGGTSTAGIIMTLLVQIVITCILMFIFNVF